MWLAQPDRVLIGWGAGETEVGDKYQIFRPGRRLIDTDTYEIVELPHEGEWLDARWGNERDVLLAMVDYDAEREDRPESHRMRLMGWDVRTVGDMGELPSALPHTSATRPRPGWATTPPPDAMRASKESTVARCSEEVISLR